jgi:sec-independent protein translocase protein TatB
VLNFSPEKLMLVFIIALVVLGPNRLPPAARTLGKVVGELKRMSGSFQTEVRDALVEPRQALSNTVGDLGLDSLRQSLRQSVNGVADSMTAPEVPAPIRPAGGATTAPSEPDVPSVSDVPSAPDDPSYN